MTLPPVGNDLVDLRLPANQASAANDRFLRRVLSADEYTTVTANGNPARALWLHWAAKESAYKAWRRTADELAFLPRKFHVTMTQCEAVAGGAGHARGTVRHGNDSVNVEWTWCEDWVHCTLMQACADRSHAVGSIAALLADPADRQIDDSDGLPPESVAVRVLAQRLLTMMGVHDARVLRERGIERRAGAPLVLLADGNEADVLLSMSHDGRFVAASLAAN